MPLQIRRGTDSERTHMAQPLAAGELVYTTDTKRLYIGDGTTIGGTGVTGYTDQNAADVAGALFEDGNASNTGITFTYDPVGLTISAEVTGVLDPTSLVNGDFHLNLNSAGQLVLPVDGDGNSRLQTNAARPWLISSNNAAGPTLSWIGTVTNGDLLTLLAPTTDHNQIIVDQSGVIIKIDANNTGTSWSFSSTGLVAESSINIKEGSLNVATATTGLAEFKTIVSPDTGAVSFKSSNGTLEAPEVLVDGDLVGAITFKGYTGADYQPAAAIAVFADTDAVNGNIPGKIVIGTMNSTGDGQNLMILDSSGVLTVPSVTAGTLMAWDGSATNPSIVFNSDMSQDTGFFHPGDGIIAVSTNGTETARFDNGGFRSTGFIKVAQVNGTLPSPPEAGMIVLDGTIFKGYNGSGWVNLN